MYFLMGGVSIGIFLNDLVLYHLKYTYIDMALKFKFPRQIWPFFDQSYSDGINFSMLIDKAKHHDDPVYG